MIWLKDLPVHIFLLSSFMLFAIGIICLWMAYRQQKKSKLDLRFALCAQNEEPIKAETERLITERHPLNNSKLQSGSYDKESIISRVLYGRQLLMQKIAQSGHSGSSAEPLFYICTILAGVTGGIIAVKLEIGISLLYADSWAIIIDTVIYVVFFSVIPFFSLKFRVRRRKEELDLHVPDLIDLLILCVGTGLTLEASLRKTTEAMANMSPMLSNEMKTMLNELRIFPDKSSAFENLQNRTSSDGLKYLFMALHQSEIYGTSVIAALRSVSVDNRKRRMIFLETTAARLPVLLSLPLIIFILPPVIAISAGPGFILMLRAIGN